MYCIHLFAASDDRLRGSWDPSLCVCVCVEERVDNPVFNMILFLFTLIFVVLSVLL